MAHEKLIVGKLYGCTKILATIMTLVNLGITVSAQQPSSTRPEGSTFAEQYFTFANGLSVDAQYDSSNIYLDKAIAIYEAMPNQNDLTIASRHIACRRLLGRNLRKLGRYEKAQFYLKKALEMGLAKLGENNIEIVNIYYEIGRLHYRISEFNLAESFLDKALKAARRMTKTGSNEKNQRIFAIIYNGLGSLYFRQGFNGKARKYYRKSLDVYLNLGPKYESIVAGRYNNLGIVANSRGDYDQALEYYRKSLDTKLKLAGRNPANATTLGNIGKTYSEKREYEQAIQIHQESLDIVLNAENRDSLKLAWTYGNLASVKFKLGRYDEALSDHNIALSILKRYFHDKSHYRIAGEYLEVAECYLGKGNFDKAMLYYHKSLSMSRAIFGDNHASVARAYCGMGRTLEERRDDETALNYYQSALKALSSGSETRHANLDSVSVEPVFLEVLERKGAVLRKLYAQNPGAIDYLERSLSAYELAIQMVDRMRRGFKNDGSKLFLGEQFAGIYENAIRGALKLFDISKEKRYWELAFAFAQKNKANLLLEKLYESEAKQFSGIPDSLLAREDSLKAGLTYYDTEIKNARSGAGDRDAAFLQKMKELYFSSKSEFDALRERFESDYPKYYQLKYQTQAVSVQQVQDALDKDTGFLEYVVTDSNVFIFAISKNEFQVNSVAIDSSFSMHVNSMLRGIRRRNYARYVAHAYPVYRTLVQPLESWLANKNRLIIVPDGLVSSIPLEALLTCDVSQSKSKQDYRTLPYLNKKFTVSYGYSTTLLFETFNNQVVQEPTLDYLAFAPAFSNGFNRDSKATLPLKSGKENSYLGGRDISLPAARDEVFAIQDIFDKSYQGVEWVRNRWFGQLTRVYVGEAATEEKVKSSELNQSRYIHFATHGVVNKKLPSLSGLVFGHETETEDGVLYLGEIYNLKLNADLAVLSACETASGKWVEGEGLISFARGFLYAGARNLLVSLWKVSDISTSNVMKEFYQGLLDGKSMAEALKEAKEKMIASEYDLAMPYYWAPFVLIGK